MSSSLAVQYTAPVEPQAEKGTLLAGEFKDGQVAAWMPTRFKTEKEWQRATYFAGGVWTRHAEMDPGDGIQVWEFNDLDRPPRSRFFAVKLAA